MSVLNKLVIPSYHEFDLDYNDFRSIANYRAARIYSELENLIGGYDLKRNKSSLAYGSKTRYKNFDRTICVVSDTHDDMESLNMLVSFCNRYQIMLMIHAGDLVDHNLIGDITRRYNGRLIIVMGNHDKNGKISKDYFRYNSKKCLVCPYEAHIKVLEDGQVAYTNKISRDRHFVSVTAPHLYVRVLHGEDQNHLRNVINFHENYDVCVYGHTHENDYRVLNLYNDKRRTKVVLNPGAFSQNLLPPDDGLGFIILGINGLQLTDVMKVNLLSSF